jgi:DedD protein
MAFFKFRTAGKDAKAGPRQAESIEVIRTRARHRLIGATVLVLIGVLGFPVLFDTQPRPISVDIPIEIPDRNKVKPLAVPTRPAAQTPVASGRVSPPPAADPAPPSQPPVVAAPQPKAEPAAPPPKGEAAAPAKPQAPAAEAKPETKAMAKPDAADDGAKAKALLDGKTQVLEGRFVVQVGAFADATKAREARAKVERAGLKTYTHVAETKDGKRIRVRVGPFPTRGEADQAASKIKGLDLPAAILTL